MSTLRGGEDACSYGRSYFLGLFALGSITYTTVHADWNLATSFFDIDAAAACAIAAVSVLVGPNRMDSPVCVYKRLLAHEGSLGTRQPSKIPLLACGMPCISTIPACLFCDGKSHANQGEQHCRYEQQCRVAAEKHQREGNADKWRNGVENAGSGRTDESLRKNVEHYRKPV